MKRINGDEGHPQCCQKECKHFYEKDDEKTIYGSTYCGYFIPAKRMNREEVEHQWYRGCCAYEKVK